MDEHLTYASQDGNTKSPRRMRTPSFQSQASSSGQRFRHRAPSGVGIGVSIESTVTFQSTSAEHPKILAPTPRRPHLLRTSESQLWLRTPPLSPGTSRGTSPVSQNFSQSSPTSSTWPRQNNHRHLSFSSLAEFQQPTTASSTTNPSFKGTKPTADGEDGMGKRWVKWMHRNGMKNWVVPGAVMATTWIKWCIGLGSYSGQATPPMFGDYEAQRHWMELTIHLPPREWYTYDLPYWGLDYPPLTAYVSWLCGFIGSRLDPSSFALYRSRGKESEASKVYMRATVVALDLIVHVPAVLLFARSWLWSRSKRTQNLAFLTLLLQPALLLVDFGHFQYNSVMLGLTLLSINCLATGHDLLAAFFFVLSLGFKQMSLYYAPAIGSYFLGKCLYLGPSRGPRLFVRLAIVTLLTFFLLFLPFLPPFASLSTILNPIARIFPFDRGLFEDKVANFWCASNVVFKWRKWGSREKLVKLSTALTAMGFLPGVVTLIEGGLKLQTKDKNAPADAHTPILKLLPYALLTSSMSFFLFSFQVHEKTILLPLLPMNLLLSSAPADSDIFAWGGLVNNIAVFSMWPLLKRDGLGVQCIAMLLLWNRLIGYNPLRVTEKKTFIHLFSIVVYAGALAVLVLEMVITPPRRYPDLFPVLNVLVSTPVFGLTWLWSIKSSMKERWALGGLGQ